MLGKASVFLASFGWVRKEEETLNLCGLPWMLVIFVDIWCFMVEHPTASPMPIRFLMPAAVLVIVGSKK